MRQVWSKSFLAPSHMKRVNWKHERLFELPVLEVIEATNLIRIRIPGVP